ncbi:MAG TPA: hypothetical protein VF181_10485 [Balneolaceae bacterium]
MFLLEKNLFSSLTFSKQPDSDGTGGSSTSGDDDTTTTDTP